MALTTLTYREWEFALDRELTQATYAVAGSGADFCVCNDCKNYVAYRDHVFPAEVRRLLAALGIDYRKEVETFRYEVLPSGLHHIAGWFHFKGKVLAGPDYREPLPGGGIACTLPASPTIFRSALPKAATWLTSRIRPAWYKSNSKRIFPGLSTKPWKPATSRGPGSRLFALP